MCVYPTKRACEAAIKEWRAANKVSEADLDAQRKARVAAEREEAYQRFVRGQARRVAELLDPPSS